MTGDYGEGGTPFHALTFQRFNLPHVSRFTFHASRPPHEFAVDKSRLSRNSRLATIQYHLRKWMITSQKHKNYEVERYLGCAVLRFFSAGLPRDCRRKESREAHLLPGSRGT